LAFDSHFAMPSRNRGYVRAAQAHHSPEQAGNTVVRGPRCQAAVDRYSHARACHAARPPASEQGRAPSQETL